MFTDIPSDTRILIIDDVAANLRLLTSSLKAFGLKDIVSFSDSRQGLEWARNESWDLLLLDLDMPEPDGFEILRQLKERERSRQPVIILTAMSDASSRRLGLELGANDYLTKPLDLPELILRVRNCLRLAQASKKLQTLNLELEMKVLERTLQLQQSHQAEIRALSRAASYRDNETGNHIRRIGDASALLAKTIGMPDLWCERLRLAAPMHDIGKIGISDAILLKEGPLTEDERKTMMQHAAIGHEILYEEQGSDLTLMAAEIAYCHHEKWDGSGYPRGLAGGDIPLCARIVALCDVYDALRMPRPYKPSWPVERAQSYLSEQSGHHFDPSLVEAIQTIFGEIENLFQDESDVIGLGTS
ncbi:HD-GYP domain-containing protein [Pseudomonas asplenii]|uniref:Response regulator receiver modulated metal dependent phosphohydrolase n=1 Tax=Pseudomonas asplenii TaxID=53407 RepID=A0A1H6LYF7_9PSED|nr:HD domain-containing phosphohydrolase [Pseudomonas fuscovaginae]SEH93891.1 response regulator receiver modulated metal dependent phosphohydrolase [Pseudomonas fuscovaginae]